MLLGTTVLIGLWPGLLLNLIAPTLQFAPVPTALERRPAMNSSLDWMIPLVPEEIVIVSALAALALDFADRAAQELWPFARRWLARSACLGCVAAMIWIACGQDHTAAEMLALTPLTQFLKLVLLALTLVVAVLSFGARFSRHVGEYFALLLIAAAGMMLLISSENLLMIFIALEMLSVPLYVLTAFNKSSLASAEAALKYFLFGSVAAAFTLFGISLLYGLTGELQLGSIAEKLGTQPIEPVCYVALVMTLAGFAFKVAVAPFHFWAPDVYEGAPAPIACFIASGSKVASFFVLARIILDGFGPLHGSAAWEGFRAGWMPLLAVLAVLSMVVGNIAALVQTSVKRLLAYSAIAHGGYALLAFFGNSRQMLPALFFYVITYALTVLGAFAVVAVVENSGSARPAGRLGRTWPARAPALRLHVRLHAVAGGHSPAFGFLRQVLSFHGGDGRRAPFRHALAGHRGGRRQRDFALLLFAGAQTDLHRRASRRRPPVSPALCRAGAHRAAGRPGHRLWLRARLVAGKTFPCPEHIRFPIMNTSAKSMHPKIRRNGRRSLRHAGRQRGRRLRRLSSHRNRRHLPDHPLVAHGRMVRPMVGGGPAQFVRHGAASWWKCSRKPAPPARCTGCCKSAR